MTAQDDVVAGISDSNVTDAALFLFYAVLLALGGLAGLIITVVILLKLFKSSGIDKMIRP